MVGFDIRYGTASGLQGGVFDFEGGDGGGFGFGLVGLAAVFPTARDQLFDGEAECFRTFGFVGDHLPAAEGDDGTIVHRVVHGGASDHDSVEEGEGAADLLAGRDGL